MNHVSDQAAVPGATSRRHHRQDAIRVLRGVAFAGNLLFCGYVLGLGTWSIFARSKAQPSRPAWSKRNRAARRFSTWKAGL